jgi:hypothetical protein
MSIISNLTLMETMSGTRPVEYYKNLWLSAFPQGAYHSKKYYRMRLKELESWDTSNNKPNERAGKIAALKILINL